MKFGKWNFPPQAKSNPILKQPAQEVFELNGNPELAKNKEIYGALSDPEFIKTFPGPADFQYDILRENLCFSKNDTQNSIAYLKNFFKTSENPNFCLIKFGQFLHTALGNQKRLAFDERTPTLENFAKEQQEISQILESGFNEISSDPDMKYFLGVTLKPEIILKETQSFEKMERDLTPIQISGGYFVQDNGFEPIPIFYHTENPDGFNSLINEQSNFFKNSRPENRSEFPKNPSMEEMKEYKDKFLNSTINFSEIKSEIRKKIAKSTHRLTPEEIQNFFPDSHNVCELTQDPKMFEFRTYINPEIRQNLEKEFGVDFKEIPLKEQMYFLTSISNRTNTTIKPVQDFTKNFGALGLRTFLSLEQKDKKQEDKKMGDKILKLGEKLPKDTAKIIFAKYGEIIDSTNDITKIMEERFGEKENPEIFSKITDSLMRKGKDLLLESSERLNRCEGNDCTNASKKLLEDLNNFSQDNVLLGSIFKTLSKDKAIKLEDIKNVSIEKFSSSEDLEKYKDRMIQIFEQNRKDYPDELLKETLEEFEEILKNPDGSEFYLLKNKEDIISYMRFKNLPSGNIYFGSYNGTSDTRGLALNGEFLRELLIEKSKIAPVEAVVYEKNPIKDVYLNKYGFEIDGEIPNYKGTGQKFYKIILKKS